MISKNKIVFFNDFCYTYYNRGNNGGGQPPPTMVPPVRPLGPQEGNQRAPPGDQPVQDGDGV